jgi:hypothetical protein
LTVKDGFSALETYLKARFATGAAGVSLAGNGAVFQRLDEAADLCQEHLNVDLRALVGGRAGSTSYASPRTGTCLFSHPGSRTRSSSAAYLTGRKPLAHA